MMYRTSHERMSRRSMGHLQGAHHHDPLDGARAAGGGGEGLGGSSSAAHPSVDRLRDARGRLAAVLLQSVDGRGVTPQNASKLDP